MEAFKTKEFWLDFLTKFTIALIIYFSILTIVHMPYESPAPEIQIDFTDYFWGHDLAPPLQLQVDYKLHQSDDYRMIVRSKQKEISITLPENAFYRIVVEKVGSTGPLKDYVIKNHSLLNAQIINSFENENFIVYEFTTLNNSLFKNEVITFKVT